MNKEHYRALRRYLPRTKMRHKVVVFTDSRDDVAKITEWVQRYRTSPSLTAQVCGTDGIAPADAVTALQHGSVPEAALVIHRPTILQNPAAYAELMDLLGVVELDGQLIARHRHQVYGDYQRTEIHEVMAS